MSSSTSYRSTVVGRLFTLATFAVLTIATTGYSQTSKSIQSILNPDGSVRSSVRSGSFDAHGYRMTTSKDGTPRFQKVSSDPNDVNWDPSFTVAGVGGFSDVVAHNGDTLYVGGSFGSAGHLVVNNIAKYNLATNTWSAFDSTSADLGTNGEVVSILVQGSDVYIGGAFTDAGGVAANNIVDYNTSTGKWSTLGTGTSNGVDNEVTCMLYFGGNLYVGGYFANAGGSSAPGIARWDGSSWHSLGTGVDNAVWALAVYNGSLYVGGQFLNAGGSAANYIAKWDGSTWSPVGAGATDLNSTVYTLLSASNGLYVGGDFTTAGATTVNYLVKLTGSTWNAVGSGVNGDVYNIIAAGSSIYVMGQYTTAGLITINNVAMVDTATNVWTPLGASNLIGTNDYAWQSVLVNNVLYAAGGFTVAGAVNAVGIASWNGTAWSSLGGTTNVPSGDVDALALDGPTIYVGGSFQTAGNVQANNIAAYNTSAHTWSSLGVGTANGVGSTVYAIGVLGGNVYVGGGFTTAGGAPARHIAMWNGTAWSTLGTSPNDGVSSTVYAIATFGTDVYVGGAFTTAGSGTTVNHMAKWSGTAWSALGTGTNGTVYAIAPGVNEIYAGGSFTTAGGSAAARVASWNGVNWSSLGTPTNGVDNTVEAMCTYGDTLFVGGFFLNAGGSSANRLAKWNTHQWTALAAGVGSAVYSMGRSGTNLYIGGAFTTSGLINATRVVEWSISDSSFATLGDGTNGTVRAILVDSSDIYFGGYFSTAGNKPSYRFARYNPNGVTAVNEKSPIANSFGLLQNYPNPFNPTTVISYQLSGLSNVSLKVYDILGREVRTLVSGKQSAGSYSVNFDGSNLASGVYFYRLVAGSNIVTKKMLLMK